MSRISEIILLSLSFREIFYYATAAPMVLSGGNLEGRSLLNEGVGPLPWSAEENIDIKNGLIEEKHRWKNFTVYIDESYSSFEREVINTAMSKLSKVLPCVKFAIFPIGTVPFGDYVSIRKGGGCSSSVGKRGGAQGLTLHSPGCIYVGTIMHELMHALGLYLEQSRPDRDDFVSIMWANIQPGREHNFNKCSTSQVSHFGVEYNSQSIMHYGSHDFSRNGQPTVMSKNGGRVGSTGELQATDILKLQRMYNCSA